MSENGPIIDSLFVSRPGGKYRDSEPVDLCEKTKVPLDRNSDPNSIRSAPEMNFLGFNIPPSGRIIMVVIVLVNVWLLIPLLPLLQSKVYEFVKYDVHLGEEAKKVALAHTARQLQANTTAATGQQMIIANQAPTGDGGY